MTLAKRITYFGQPATVACDERCDKAFGITGRPRHQLSENVDDYEYLSDDEVGEAPIDPGTSEGGERKPQSKGDRLNKWCVRQCERCVMSKPGEGIPWLLPDFRTRQRDIQRNDETPSGPAPDQWDTRKQNKPPDKDQTWHCKATWVTATGNIVETAMSFVMPSGTTAIQAGAEFVKMRQLSELDLDSLEVLRLPSENDG